MKELDKKMEKLVRCLHHDSLKISSMESCTGGMFMALLTNVEGSSNITEGGFVTYSNMQKTRMGVPSEVIEKHTVYSSQCAKAMAHACKTLVSCDVSIGITGTLSNADPANPGGVPGVVYYCISSSSGCIEKQMTVPVMNRDAQKKHIIMNILESLEMLLKY